MLPGLDVSGLEETMPEADFAAFQAYLPVLTGEETFRWVAGPYDSGDPDGDWEPFDADMAASTGSGAMMMWKTRRRR